MAIFNFKQPNLYLMGLVALLLSCNPNSLQLKKIGEQIFETNFVPSSRFSGVFEDKITGQEFVYLGNGRTERKVSFFSSEGKRIKTIDFKKATRGYSLSDISIWSLDTILALSQNTGLVFFINNNGDLIKTLDIQACIPDSIEARIETSWGDDFLYNSELYFCLTANGTKIDTSLSGLEWLLEYYNYSLELPYLLKVDKLFDNEPNCTPLIDAFYANFISKDYVKDEIPNFTINNDRVYIISLIPDTLYCYDLTKGHLDRYFIDYKQKTKAHERLLKNNKENMNKMQEHILWQTRSASFLTKCFEDQNDLIHLFAYHKFNGKEEECWDKRNWSWLVYNEHFEKLNEFVITDYYISPSFSFLTKNGIYLKVRPNYIKNYDPHKTHFDIYAIE